MLSLLRPLAEENVVYHVTAIFCQMFSKPLPYLRVAIIGSLLLFGMYLRYAFFWVSVENLPVITDEALNMMMAKAIANGEYPLLFWTQPYQFPLEAYLLSLFHEFVPNDAFGARVFLALGAGLSLFGFFAVAFYSSAFQRTAIWPALALIAAPSSYFIIRQIGMTIPQYTSSVTFAWLLPLLFVLSRRSQRSHLFGIPIGICAGLAISTHLLTLSIVFPVILAYCLGKNLKQALQHTLTFLPGLFLGLLPYFFSHLHEGAYDKVSTVLDIRLALQRLWDPILTRLFTVAMGINPSVFPDFDYRTGPFGYLIFPFVLFFLGLLTFSILTRLWRLGKLLLQKQWPALDEVDIFTAATLLVLLLAAFAGFGLKYRYVLPVTWYFPFLFQSVYSSLKSRSLRVPLGITVIALVFINSATLFEIKNIWSRKHFSYGIPKLPPISPLVEYMKAHNITRCYAPWWLVYRINYATDGQVNCAQPFNERFPGWPLPPAKQAVDAASDTPYIITRKAQGVFLSTSFERELRTHQIEFDRHSVNHYFIYDNFRHASARPSTLIPAESFSLKADSPPTIGSQLTDQSTRTTWSPAENRRNAAIEIVFKEPETVHLLKIYDAGKHFKKDTKPIRVSYFANGDWKLLIKKSFGLQHRTKITATTNSASHNGTILSFGFPEVTTKKLKIELAYKERAVARPLKIPWRLAEIELFGHRSAQSH